MVTHRFCTAHARVVLPCARRLPIRRVLTPWVCKPRQVLKLSSAAVRRAARVLHALHRGDTQRCGTRAPVYYSYRGFILHVERQPLRTQGTSKKLRGALAQVLVAPLRFLYAIWCWLVLRTSAGRRFVLGATARRSLTYLSSPVLSQCELMIFIVLRWMWKRLANRSPRRPQAAPWQPNHRGWAWYAPGLQGPVFNTRSCSDDQPFSGCPGRLASPVGASLIRQAMDANPILVPWHTLRRAWWRRGPA